MIEFTGELTGKCKKFLLNKQKKFQTIASFVILIIFSIPIILVAVNANVLALLFFIPIFIMLFGSMLPPSKTSQKLFMPIKVFVTLEENMIVHQGEKTERFHSFNSVKKIIDYGEWYYFVFFYSDRDPYFVCQKSLLTQGTLEEFEAHFEGKIERIDK